MRWRNPRFRLRTLLVLIAVVAVGLVVVQRSLPKPPPPPIPAWLASWIDRQGPPADRLAHFAWINRALPNVRVVGWRESLVSETPIFGGRVVKIHVVPILRGGGVPFTSDHFFETYESRSGQIRYLRGRGPAGPQSLFTD